LNRVVRGATYFSQSLRRSGLDLAECLNQNRFLEQRGRHECTKELLSRRVDG